MSMSLKSKLAQYYAKDIQYIYNKAYKLSIFKAILFLLKSVFNSLDSILVNQDLTLQFET